MIKIKNVTAKNFISIGNQTQSVDFDRSDLTLVLGENLDLGGDDHGARNGTGKTTILNALSYALYGQPLTKIKQDNLINKTNDKNMLVTVEFEVGDIEYRIERGRKPNVLKFFIDGDEEKDNKAQGTNANTQEEIERLLGLGPEMFKHIVALNTYTEPFLSMRVSDQREIIEQLLGITLLSEKADSLRNVVKETKDAITAEEAEVKSIIDGNNRMQEQIETLKSRQRMWSTTQGEQLEELGVQIIELGDLDINVEIQLHKELEKWAKASETNSQINSNVNVLVKQITYIEAELDKSEKALVDAENHICHACGQDIAHLVDHQTMLDTLAQTAKDHASQLSSLADQLERNQELFVDEFARPNPFYNSMDEALHHKDRITQLETKLEEKADQVDPYIEQIEGMEKSAIKEVVYTKLNELTSFKEHQEFLLKLLTNKDSFVRKRIIDQNLEFLNTRLNTYLQKIKLPHKVTFMNDLSVEITELGRELDFDNLSRGERNRLILSLSWAFRDVWESLYSSINLLFIDELIDSGMDGSGVESALSILKKFARDMNKSVWLVSHRDDLISRVHNVMLVTKSNGFTSYDSNPDNY